MSYWMNPASYLHMADPATSRAEAKLPAGSVPVARFQLYLPRGFYPRFMPRFSSAAFFCSGQAIGTTVETHVFRVAKKPARGFIVGKHSDNPGQIANGWRHPVSCILTLEHIEISGTQF